MTTHKMMIVGEAWGAEDARRGQPFVGASGSVLNSMLRANQIRREECYLTNVFNFQPVGNNLDNICGPKTEAIPDWPQLGKGLWVRKQFQTELDRLLDEVQRVKPNVILALGATALWALTKNQGIKKHRGTPVLDFTRSFKILPTYHPSAIMRQWKLRPIAIMDIGKAKKQSDFPEIIRPERFVHIPETINDIRYFYQNYILGSKDLSCDIETAKIAGLPTITEVGFAPTPKDALVIPFLTRAPGKHNYWPSHEIEKQAWQWVRRICTEFPLFGQNFNYDMQYFLAQMGIFPPTISDDTMILHHAMYPEMEKSLGFLGSIYTDEPSWKFMRTSSGSFKKEE